MGELLSKLRKKEHNTDTSIYQIYLPKLHESIMKYYRFNLFKEIAIGFSYGLETSSESPASISDDLLV